MAWWRRDLPEAVRMCRIIADARGCQTFSVDRSEDLGGAMLTAALHKQREAGLEWRDCLQLIVSWNHVKIMKWSVLQF